MTCPYFEQMVSQIYPLNSSKIRRIHQILTWNCSLLIRIVSSTIYDFKRDDFKIEIVNFPFLDGVVPRSPSYGVYISQRIHFMSLRVSSNFNAFNNKTKLERAVDWVPSQIPTLKF